MQVGRFEHPLPPVAHQMGDGFRSSPPLSYILSPGSDMQTQINLVELH